MLIGYLNNPMKENPYNPVTEPVKVKLPKEVVEFIKSNGTAFWFGDSNPEFFNLPQWFQSTDNPEVFEVLFPHNMPKGLKIDLKIDQELSTLQEKYNKLEEAFEALFETHYGGRREEDKIAFKKYWIEDYGLAGLKEQ